MLEVLADDSVDSGQEGHIVGLKVLHAGDSGLEELEEEHQGPMQGKETRSCEWSVVYKSKQKQYKFTLVRINVNIGSL